jgi:rhodanese-related sulfurtransferase
MSGLAKVPEPEWKSLVVRTAGGYEVQGSESLDASQAKALHDRGALFAYTVGFHGDFFESRIPGSVSVAPHQQSKPTLRQLFNGKRAVVFYGTLGLTSSGHSAAQVTAKAISMGFENVHYFKGGLTAWIAAGYPVDKGP